MSEIWKAIPGFEGQYEVSDQGRVRSLDRIILCSGSVKGDYLSNKKGKLLRLGLTRGYLQVVIENKSYKIHRLVLLAFIGPRPEGFDISHINGDKKDNRLLNLRYATRSENNYDCSRRDGFRVSRESVQFIRKNCNSHTDMAGKFNITETHVRNIRKNKVRIHG